MVFIYSFRATLLGVQLAALRILLRTERVISFLVDLPKFALWRALHEKKCSREKNEIKTLNLSLRNKKERASSEKYITKYKVVERGVK